MSSEKMVLTDETNDKDENSARISSEFTEGNRRRADIEGRLDKVLARLSRLTEEPRARPEVAEKAGQTKEYTASLMRMEERLKEKAREQRYIDARGLKQRQPGMGRGPTEGERHVYPVEEASKLRAEILSKSLFPNLYNRANLMSAM